MIDELMEWSAHCLKGCLELLIGIVIMSLVFGPVLLAIWWLIETFFGGAQ